MLLCRLSDSGYSSRCFSGRPLRGADAARALMQIASIEFNNGSVSVLSHHDLPFWVLLMHLDKDQQAPLTI